MKTLTTKTKPLTYERLMASLEKTDRILSEKLDKTDRILSEKFAETDRMIKNLSKQLGGMGNSNGDMAEAYFINSFTKKMYFAGQNYDSISSNLSKKVRTLNLQDEYDLVLYNGTSVVIIEIKYKADSDDIESLLKKAHTFKKLFPEYVNYELYLGLAGFSMNKKVEKEALKKGIAVIKQVGDMMVINDENLRVF